MPFVVVRKTLDFWQVDYARDIYTQPDAHTRAIVWVPRDAKRYVHVDMWGRVAAYATPPNLSRDFTGIVVYVYRRHAQDVTDVIIGNYPALLPTPRIPPERPYEGVNLVHGDLGLFYFICQLDWRLKDLKRAPARWKYVLDRVEAYCSRYRQVHPHLCLEPLVLPTVDFTTFNGPTDARHPAEPDVLSGGERE